MAASVVARLRWLAFAFWVNVLTLAIRVKRALRDGRKKEIEQ